MTESYEERRAARRALLASATSEENDRLDQSAETRMEEAFQVGNWVVVKFLDEPDPETGIRHWEIWRIKDTDVWGQLVEYRNFPASQRRPRHIHSYSRNLVHDLARTGELVFDHDRAIVNGEDVTDRNLTLTQMALLALGRLNEGETA